MYSELASAFLRIYDRTTYRHIGMRRIGISFDNIQEEKYVQLNLFKNQEKIDKERKLELVINQIKNEMGKNMILRGMNLEEGATSLVRNTLIGGHKG